MRRSIFSGGHSYGRRLYGRRRRRGPIAIALMVVAAAALVFVGYSIQKPLADLISGRYSSSSAASSTSSAASSSSSSSSGKTSSSSATVKAANIMGIYLPQKYLSDSASLSSVASSAKSAGLNMAVVNLKGEDGHVNYASKISEVQGTDIVAANAPDASAAAKALSDAGITPAAKISCFKDPVGADAMRDACVKYAGDHSMSWLDPTNRWLNPYSDKAQQYIIDLAVEAVSLGYKQIYLDNLEFPTGDSKAWYGDNLPTKEEALRSFTAKAAQAVEAAGGKLAVVMPGDASVGQGNAQKGQDQSLYGFTADYYSPNLCPSLFSKGVTVGGAVATDTAPGNTVGAAAQTLLQTDSSKAAQTVPFIQAYNGSRAYTADDVNAQITALRSAGIGNFILYSSDGTYSLSGVQTQ